MARWTVWLGIAIMCSVALTGCSHRRGLHSAKERRLTVGVVQKEIRVGMHSAEVAAALGSPNIVTRDSQNKEAWIYDKIATEASYSNSSGNVAGSAGAATVVGTTPVAGTLGGGYGRNKGASATTQKTLTVIIRFDTDSNVESFSYHASTF